MGGELFGLYVFGSAAFPGFVPRSGDIDFIAVTWGALSGKQREQPPVSVETSFSPRWRQAVGP